jgi:hypothetical protein
MGNIVSSSAHSHQTKNQDPNEEAQTVANQAGIIEL